MRRKGLGRGLSDLLSGEGATQSRAVIEVPLDDIEPNPNQPRQHIDDSALEELTISVETHGVLQPIMVRSVNNAYQIVAGERRWRAARRAGLRTIPCLVQNADDLQSLEIAMIENLQRDDLNCLDAARGYKLLMQDFGMTQEEVSRKIGKSRSAVANSLRVLELPDHVQGQIRGGLLSEGHGRALLPLLDRPQDFEQVLQATIEQGLSVRGTEKFVRELISPSSPETTGEDAASDTQSRTPRQAHDVARDPHVAAAEQSLQTALAAKVAIRPGAKRGGVIHIRYYDSGDLERILGMLTDAEER
ncbi:MAG: ParB/RepB/Spo0J family partition protein [Armatimonadota bacterium]